MHFCISLLLDETADVRDDSSELAEDMVEQVLGLQEPDLELPADDQVLVSQAGHLLEEPDITNVLNTIQPDEFNDFFTGNILHLSYFSLYSTPMQENQVYDFLI